MARSSYSQYNVDSASQGWTVEGKWRQRFSRVDGRGQVEAALLTGGLSRASGGSASQGWTVEGKWRQCFSRVDGRGQVDAIVRKNNFVLKY